MTLASRFVVVLVLLAAAGASHAGDQAAVPAPAPNPQHVALDPAMAARLKRLEGELRCLVCQNQTLADSEAGLAQDLRNEVETLALQGKSDDEIKAWLQARYGDFVLFKPPVKPVTWGLWFGPFVLLVVALAYWAWRLARKQQSLAPLKADAADFEAILDEASRR